MNFRYCAFGLQVASPLRLPQLPLAGDTGRLPDLSIEVGSVPPAPADAGGEQSIFQIADGDVALAVSGVARYRIRGGKEIVVDPAPGSSDGDICLFLLGSALGVLCHQRGLFPLHANAIGVDGRVIAFAGPSGTGKSTLAAHFGACGYEVLADDVCVLSFDAAGRPMAWPGLRRLKLWRDAAEFFGHDCDALDRVMEGYEKFHVAISPAAAAGPFPLAGLYILNEDAVASRPGIEALTGSRALDALMGNTYRAGYLRVMGLLRQHFAQCVGILDHVPIYAAPWRRGFKVMAEEAANLERHFRRHALGDRDRRDVRSLPVAPMGVRS